MGQKMFKVKRSNDTKLYGIAVKSREECIKKGCAILKIPTDDLKHIELIDGTIIDDAEYLSNLEKNTILVFVCKTSKGSAAGQICDTLKALRMNEKTCKELLNLAESLSDRLQKDALIKLVYSMKGNCEAETREEDPEWFKRVADTKMLTKSAVLEYSAMNRVRSYLYEARSQIKEADLNSSQRKLANEIISRWLSRLKQESMYKAYFSRKNMKPYTFCDKQGWFSCEGDYLVASCPTLHSINPYLSSEHRAVFSQWNLDHRIEKARTIIPKMILLLKEKTTLTGKVNWDYFYDLLFTRANLKLVHIACHIKQEHLEAVLDDQLLYNT